ncbi:MAG TPA: Ig-like domain-containing protein, partial [Nitrospirota bacterium]
MIEKLYYSLAGQRNGAGAGMIPSFLMLAIAVMAFALGSCGGTGPLPPADTTAPTVRAVNPINGALNVPLDTAIIITFSEAMDPASINSQAIILSSESGTTVAGTVSYSNMTAEFKPTRDLNSSTWYSVRINDSVRDAAGNAMNAPFGYSFRTGDTIPP